MAPLSDADVWTLDRIVTAPEAFLPAADLGDVADLVGRSLVELWHRPDFLAATLTPLGAAVMAVEIAERWAFQRGEGSDGEPVTEAYEEPYWVAATAEPRRPLRSLRHAHEVPLPCPDLVAETPAAGEYLMDDETGEPVTLWGRAVPVDRRLRRAKAAGKTKGKTKRRAG